MQKLSGGWGMIDLRIRTDGKHIQDSLNNKNCTLIETALVVYRLEELKLVLLEKEFKSEFEVSEE